MKSHLLASLFDREPENLPLTVSQLNEQVKRALERGFASVWLEGEITNFSAAASGHWYFTLRDEFAQIKAACFRGANYKIRFEPFDGLQVRVRGNLSVFEPRGEYQLIVDTLDPIGEGAFKIAFEQLRTKLEREGLFDVEFKQTLPVFPKRVGVVTSPNGAAIHDILNVLTRRTKTVSIVFIPTRVQGEGAGDEIAEAIKLANKFNAQTDEKIDVLIVGRGGGSREDLWAFNDEKLAREIGKSKIPIISAVGHETDFTIADFVADLRAPTPSAAAELVAAREDQLEAYLVEKEQDLRQIMNYKILEARSNLSELNAEAVFGELKMRVANFRQRIETAKHRIETLTTRRTQENGRRFENLQKRFSPVSLQKNLTETKARCSILREQSESAIRSKIDGKDEALKVAMASLDALSPLSVLRRGFALTQKESGFIVRDSAQVEIGETVQILLAKGKIKAEVVKIEN